MTRSPRPRPGALRWLLYAYGRPLPASMQPWVRFDLTSRWAFPRHVLRSEILYVPVFVALVLLPRAFAGPFWVSSLSALLAVLLSTIYSVIYREQNRRRRLHANGLPEDLETDRAEATNRADRSVYELTYRRPDEGR